MFEKITQSITKKGRTHRMLQPFCTLARWMLFGWKAVLQVPARRFVALLLAVSLTFGMTGGFAFAANEGADGSPTVTLNEPAAEPESETVADTPADKTEPEISTGKTEPVISADKTEPVISADKTEPVISTDKTEPVIPSDKVTPDSEQGASPDTEEPDTVPSPEDGVNTAVCTCQPVESGEMVHSEDCPLYTAPEKTPAEPEAPTASDAVLAQIQALKTIADTGKAPDADAVKAARAAYDALTDEEKAAFPADALATLEMLEAALLATPLTDNAISILVNHKSCSGATLKDAVRSGYSDAFDVETLKITAGTVTAADWAYLAGGTPGVSQPQFSSLKTFEISETVSVADPPEGTKDYSILGHNTVNITIPQPIKISNYMFSWLTELETINIPKATSIGNHAFSYCTKLKIANFPVAESIGDNAFAGCDVLETVNIPVATSIGDNAFGGCDVLETVNIPEATSLGKNAFDSCKILETVSFLKITSIEAGAFRSCSNLKTPTIPNATSIGESAFQYCHSLNSVEFLKVTDIQPNAFDYCEELKTASFPVAKSIRTDAFDRCETLTTLKLGATVPTAGGSAFGESSIPGRILKIVDANGKDLEGKALTDAQATYDKADSDDYDGLWYCWYVRDPVPKLPRIVIKINGNATEYGGETLNEAVTASGAAANSITTLEVAAGYMDTDDWKYFAGGTPGITISPFTALQTFEVNEAVTSVFKIPDAKIDFPIFPMNIKIVIIPQGTVVGDYVFYGCGNLTDVKLPEVGRIGGYAFYGCKELNAPSFLNVTAIGDYAFYGCKELNAPSFPDVTAIGDYAFANCTKLSTLKLGAAVPTVGGSNAFALCPQAGTLVLVDKDGARLTGSELSTALRKYDNVIAHGNIASDSKWYGWSMSDSIAYALNININGVINVSGDSLEEAVATSKVMPNAITTLTITEGKVTTEDWNYLLQLKSLTDFTIAAAVKEVADIPDSCHFPETIVNVTVPQAIKIASHAFTNRSALKTVSFPAATSIEAKAFAYCTALESVSFPAVTSLGEGAFWYCDALKTVSFPLVTKIEAYTFDGCKFLETASFPAATSISGRFTFGDCISLVTLKLGTTVPDVESFMAFTNCPKNRSVVIVDANGNPLTDKAALNKVIAAYKAAEIYEPGLWYGWKLSDGTIIPVTGVSLDQLNLWLETGKSETLTAMVTPATASNTVVRWKSSAETVATVNEKGKVIAVHPGTAIITVTTADGGKTDECFVSVTSVATKSAPGGKLEALLTKETVDKVFGDGNATLNPNGKIKINNSVTVESPIEIETNITIDLAGNTIIGKPGQPTMTVGDSKSATIGGGVVSGADNPGGAGSNGINGSVYINKDTVVRGGDGATGGDGIQSKSVVWVEGNAIGGNGSSGNGGRGVNSRYTNVTGKVTGGNSSSGNGGSGITGGDVAIGVTGSRSRSAISSRAAAGSGSATGGNGGGSAGAGGAGVDVSGDIKIGSGCSVTGGNGSGTGSGGDGAKSSSGDIIVYSGGSATGGNGGNTSSGTGGSGGNGTSTGGATTIENGATATGGNGGSGSSAGGNGGSGVNSGSTTVNGSATGGAGGNGGTGGSGVNQSSGIVGGSGTVTGGSGGGKGIGGGATAGDNLTAKNTNFPSTPSTDNTSGGGSTITSSMVSGSGSSLKKPSTAATTKNVLDNFVGNKDSLQPVTDAVKNAAASGLTSASASLSFANYAALTMNGVKAINDAVAKAAEGTAVKLALKVRFDQKLGNTFVSRVSMDAAALAKAMTGNVQLGVSFDQKSAQVAKVNNHFSKYFTNKTVSVVYNQKKPLNVNAEFAGKLNLENTFGSTQSLYFYSYDNETNAYTRITTPNYFVDTNGYTHFTAPFGGSVIITDAPLTGK